MIGMYGGMSGSHIINYRDIQQMKGVMDNAISIGRMRVVDRRERERDNKKESKIYQSKHNNQHTISESTYTLSL